MMPAVFQGVKCNQRKSNLSLRLARSCNKHYTPNHNEKTTFLKLTYSEIWVRHSENKGNNRLYSTNEIYLLNRKNIIRKILYEKILYVSTKFNKNLKIYNICIGNNFQIVNIFR